MSIKRSIVLPEKKKKEGAGSKKKVEMKGKVAAPKERSPRRPMAVPVRAVPKSIHDANAVLEPREFVEGGKTLVIVESPAKSKTIEKFLGADKYVVRASKGHLRDLSDSQLGVDIDNGFIPSYYNLPKQRKIIDELKAEADKAGAILLATDPDREGEAISWHLSYILQLKPENDCRITFQEITESAILDAIQKPRSINMDMVDAQQARRILDRLVGYKLSPLLWKKVCKGLSAGRVQSVALKLVCDREEEIRAFVPEEYWSLHGIFGSTKDTAIEFECIKVDGEKLELKTEGETQALVEEIKEQAGTISSIKKTKRQRKSSPPFTTSTLQQEAAGRLNFGAKRTMVIAQALYEGVSVGPMGHVGLITYMRTDSTRISKEMQELARDYIKKTYGEAYCPKTAPVYGAKQSAQDAHEGIRPTSLDLPPDKVAAYVTPEQLKLYTLIWNRFLASQMTAQQRESIAVELQVGRVTAKALGQKILFPGFTAVYGDVKKEGDTLLPPLEEGMVLNNYGINGVQHFTQAPPRYSEATLIKTLEEKGIGRPSTYAPTMDTIVKRNYVERIDKQFVPTELGFIVIAFLLKYFSKIINEDFTAHLEEELDSIASGSSTYLAVMDEFYKVFSKELTTASEADKVSFEIEAEDQVCPECGHPLVYKFGRFGRFLACSQFPDCSYTQQITVGTGVQCPKCKEGEIVERKSRRGKVFYGCDHYPECDFLLWDKPTGAVCDTCGSLMVERRSKNGNVKTFCSNEECPTRPKKASKRKKDEAAEKAKAENEESLELAVAEAAGDFDVKDAESTAKTKAKRTRKTAKSAAETESGSEDKAVKTTKASKATKSSTASKTTKTSKDA